MHAQSKLYRGILIWEESLDLCFRNMNSENDPILSAAISTSSRRSALLLFWSIGHLTGSHVWLVAVATRMYHFYGAVCLSLFCPLLSVPCWRRHSESHGKKKQHTWCLRRGGRRKRTNVSWSADSHPWVTKVQGHRAEIFLEYLKCRRPIQIPGIAISDPI